ncbi:MAG: hypothetical protein ACRCUY_10705 [Thermoguttaceae bacterium]
MSHIIYAALLENASVDLADLAFAVLEDYFIDWNEIRVSSVFELADTIPMLPDPQKAGERVRTALRGIFERTYQFDLEDLRKKGKNLSQSIEFLESTRACSRFMIDYASQVALGGHQIPLDEATLRVFRLLGMTHVNEEGTKEEVPGLERAVPKKEALSFSICLHQFSATFFSDPESAALRKLLKTIDPEVISRNCTPPILVAPKIAPPPTRKPDLSTPRFSTPLAFVEHDDDLDDEAPIIEPEFIPEEEVIPGLKIDAARSKSDSSSKKASKLSKKANTFDSFDGSDDSDSADKSDIEKSVSKRAYKLKTKQPIVAEESSKNDAKTAKSLKKSEKDKSAPKSLSSVPEKQNLKKHSTPSTTDSEKKVKSDAQKLSKNTTQKEVIKMSDKKNKSKPKSIDASESKTKKSATRQLQGKKPK